MLFWAKMKLAAMVTLAAILVGGAGVATYVVAAGGDQAPANEAIGAAQAKEAAMRAALGEKAASRPATQAADGGALPALTIKDLIRLRAENGRLAGSWSAEKSPVDIGPFRTTDPPMRFSAKLHEGELNRPGNFWIEGTNMDQRNEAGAWMCTARATGDVLWLRVHYGEKNPTCAIEMMVDKDKIRLIRTAWDKWDRSVGILRDLDVTAPDLKQLGARDPEKVGKYLPALLSLFSSADLLKPGSVQAKVVSGSDALAFGVRGTDKWIAERMATQGSPEGMDSSEWTNVTEEKKEIYRTMQGGRLIEAVASRTNGEVVVTVSGFKIGKTPREIKLPDRAGEGTVVQLTDYPRPNNLFLAVRVGEGSAKEPQ